MCDVAPITIKMYIPQRCGCIVSCCCQLSVPDMMPSGGLRIFLLCFGTHSLHNPNIWQWFVLLIVVTPLKSTSYVKSLSVAFSFTLLLYKILGESSEVVLRFDVWLCYEQHHPAELCNARHNKTQQMSSRCCVISWCAQRPNHQNHTDIWKARQCHLSHHPGLVSWSGPVRERVWGSASVPRRDNPIPVLCCVCAMHHSFPALSRQRVWFSAEGRLQDLSIANESHFKTVAE